MSQICRALTKIARQFPQYVLLYAVHLNPNVRETVHRLLDGQDNILLLPPLGYAHFVHLMSECRLILTDSGGIQEEAPSLNKPVLVMREVTERPEVIKTGAARLVGTQPERIVGATRELLENNSIYAAMAAAENPYGDGRAAKRIRDIMAAAQ